MERIIKTLRVAGMTCGSCVRHVERAVGELPGVETADVDLGRGQVTVTLRPGALRQDGEIEAAVRRAGYDVVGEVEAPKESARANGCGCGCG